MIEDTNGGHVDHQAPAPIWIDKREVAARQIAAAILMFFEDQDSVATHSVVAAAHQILIDLGAREDIHSIVKGPKAQRDRHARLSFAANFFKHADRDADGNINVAPLKELTAEFLMDSVYLLQRISKQLPLEGKIYWHWFVKTRPELFEGSGQELDQMIAAEFSTKPDDLARLVRLIWAVGEDRVGEFLDAMSHIAHPDATGA
jgi:hypothetical protein